MTPDSDLLSAYADSRANHAFAEFVERYAALVYRCALRSLNGDAHAAQDVTQNVFTLAAKKAESLAAHASVVGWLHTTTRLSARDYLRAAGRRQRHEQAAVPFELYQDVPSVSWERIQPIIDDVLARLADGDREVVMLRYFAELPFAAIGHRLGIGENAARMRVERALEKLRGHLETRGIESTGAALAIALGGEAAAAVVPTELAASVAAAALSSGVGAITVGGLVGLATASKLIAAMCSALIIGSVAVLGYSLYARATARAEADAAEADANAAELRAHQFAARATAEEGELARIRAGFNSTRLSQNRPGMAGESKAPDNWDPKREGDALMARHPDVRAAMAAWRRSTVLFQMGNAARDLHLTPDQVERLIEIQSRGTTLMGDWAVGGKSVVLSVDSQQTAISGADLIALLGVDGLKRWNAVQMQAPARTATAELASSLAFSEVPLTAEQADTLSSALSAHTEFTPSGLNIDWSAVSAAAQEILTPTQLAAFDRLREQAIAERQLELHAPLPKPATNAEAARPTS